MSDDYLKMREFIEIARTYGNEPMEDGLHILEEKCEVIPLPRVEHPLVTKLKEAVSKMRNHLEDDPNQDVALGVEMGLQRAADMIEHVINNGEF